MTGFVVGALLCAVIATSLLLRPWWRNQPAVSLRQRFAAALLAIAAVSAALALYLHLSQWSWSGDTEADAATARLVTLRDAANAAPQDSSAWLRLGNAYLQIQQYPLAARAFERGNKLAGYRDLDGLQGLAESYALDGDTANDAQVDTLFNRVLELNPRAPKALFYTGMSALQSGRLPVARERFSTMLTLGDAPADVRAALQRQIAAIDTQLKPAIVDARTTVRVHVEIAAALQERYSRALKAGAQLFVFVRGASSGPPLAVKRMDASLPVDISLSAADAMIVGNVIKPAQRVSVVARVSRSGSPLAQPGDLSGEISYVAGKGGTAKIVIATIAP
jgi:cytochrome c-type biogenesis protein CcmH